MRKLCTKSFKKVGELVRYWLKFHGGVLWTSPDIIRADLLDELGGEVDRSAIEHYGLCLPRHSMGVSVRGDSAIVYDTQKFPGGLPKEFSPADHQIDPRLEVAVV